MDSILNQKIIEMSITAMEIKSRICKSSSVLENFFELCHEIELQIWRLLTPLLPQIVSRPATSAEIIYNYF